MAALILDCVPEGPLGPLMPYGYRTGEPGDPANGLIEMPRRLTLEQSDVVVRIAGAVAKAIDVLGDRKKAVRWLTASNRALGGEIPITLLDTSAGAHEVDTVLDRIEYGVYS